MATSPLTAPSPVFVTCGEFARRVGVSTATVRRMCIAGELAYIVVSSRGDRRIPAAEVDRLLHVAMSERSDVTS